MKSPSSILKLDPITNTIETPTLILKTRSLAPLGTISDFTNWNISFVGVGMDEFSFDIYKQVNGHDTRLWDSITDLKIIELQGYGNFEISVSYADATETIKSVHGISLETELAQIPVYELHINDEEATDPDISTSFDDQGNFIPTVFCDKARPEYSLLHRVLKDKAPHWTIGYVTPYVVLDKDEQPERSDKFQRTYTCDGTTIYDFLTGEVATETNVVFVFDTLNRVINCYSLYDCIDQTTHAVLASAIGEDTTIFASKNMLANSITINSNKDELKNCFRVEGGDEFITDMVRVANVNGSNYIYQFSAFQYEDMSPGLVEKLTSYEKRLSGAREQYYGEDGIFTRLCKTYDDLHLKTSGMMPDVKIDQTTAEKEYQYLYDNLNLSMVAVSSVNNFDNNLFVGVTNNVMAMAQILVDPRYDVTVINNTESYSTATKQWKGKFRVERKTDNKDVFPVATNEDASNIFTVNITDDELSFTKQKLEKALAKGDILNIDFTLSEAPYTNPDGTLNEVKITEYFSQYSLNRLKSFMDGYNSCVSVLMNFGQQDKGTDEKKFYDRYHQLYTIVSSVYNVRQEEVNKINATLSSILSEQTEFQKQLNFKEWLGSYYNEFCSYRREDSYQNSNYISEGLTDTECIKKAKELVEVATKEARKACVLQRTVDVSLNNLFAIPEFAPLYDKFALFNYIRVQTEDEIIKLRIVRVDFAGTSPSDITVEFSDQIESVGGAIDDVQNILNQASSMATSFSSTTLQAKQGAEAQSVVQDMYNYGINAAKTLVRNSDSNEVSYGSYGILCKNMSDEGSYGDKQLRIIGNGMYLTDNNWQNVKMAIGEISPLPGQPPMYGVIADAVIGKLIAGDNLFIGNDDGSVTIDHSGITIKNGVIQSDDYTSPGRGGLKIDLRGDCRIYCGDQESGFTFDNNGLSVSGVIAATSLTATNGRIAGFIIKDLSLYTNVIMPLSNVSREMTSVINETVSSGLSADPLKYAFWAGETEANGSHGDTENSDAKFTVDHYGNFVANAGKIGPFNITHHSIFKGIEVLGAPGNDNIYLGNQGFSLGDQLIFQSSSGKLSVKGTLTADEGKIGPFNISSYSLWKGSNEFDAFQFNAIYLGDKGFSLGGRFSYDSQHNILKLSGLLEIGGDATIGYQPYEINLPGFSSVGNQFVIDSDVAFPRRVVVEGFSYFAKGVDSYGYSYFHHGVQIENNLKILKTTDSSGQQHGGIYLDYMAGIRGKTNEQNGNYYNICRTEQRGDLIPSGKLGNSVVLGNDTLRTYLFAHKTIYTNVPISSASDRRFKTNFKRLDERYLQFFDNLSPTLFNWKSDGLEDTQQSIGYIAQEVSEAMKIAGISQGENGIIHFTHEPANDDLSRGIPQPTYSLTYEYLDTVAAYALQDARRRISQLEREIQELKEKIK